MGSSASESPPPPKLVAIQDLPIYKAESVPAARAARPVDTIGRPATFGEEVFGNFRLVALQLRDFVSEKLGVVNSSLAPIRDAANATEQFILDEQRKVLPRAVAISMGGMAGFVAAMRKGGRMRRTFYPLIGLLTMTAFCYPNETVHSVRVGIAHSQSAWHNFKQAPEPKSS